MPLQKQHSGGGDSGGAVASSSGGIPSSKHHRRAKGLTAAIRSEVSQKQQRAKETAAGKKALVDDVMTPQKLRHGGKKAGTISRGRGVVDRRTPSRPLSRSISQTQPDGEKNTEGKAPTLNKESTTDKNTIVHVMEGQDLQEADDEIQMLNDLGLGEDISSDEFLKYFEQLPTKPAVDIYTELDNEQLTALYERHARYRIRYLKLSQTDSLDKLNAELTQHNAMDLLEEDLSRKLLAKMRYFKHFEEDGTLDWFFHPDLCRIEALDDYHRLVLRNHVGSDSEYAGWDKYRKFFYSYETEQEYINYFEELSNKLKWMEGYVLIEETSLKFGKISTRGAYQAIKIATGFSKITGELAYTGYYECVDNLRFDAYYLNDLDGVYFEIWLRVTMQMSFRDALEEIYKLEMFPSRQERMKYALDYDCSDMEMEFLSCTASVTSEVTEDKARELIAEAVKKIDRPKLYEHYIRKKIAIAQAIGLIPMVKQDSDEPGQQVDV
ncbi:uncharacterized protein LOC120651500 isoform X2 [Panicum virgatum]|uniref:Uncharacterized protein n=1 Tax=Panicum virgatum TaxID=38727 RepID=A0A8T0NNM7_PANVG|nr:uncharacterized protein LOC120651500 isoform X2 [Panicum virgatum]KAG2550165.1 hypothetical protein PVAP13_9KG236500 [Panicum virgatum]